MKKIIILISSIVFVIGILLFIMLNVKEMNSYLGVTYQAKDKNACLTFYDKGEYEMYDCDSEPTDYYFDSENDCTYEFNKKTHKINFDCKSSVYNKKNVEIDVIKWDKEEFKFIYEGKEITFYKYFDRQFLLPLDKIYKSEKNELKLNSDGTFENKICDRKCIYYQGVLDHTDNLITFYYDKKKVNGKWEKYEKIVDAEVTYDYEINLEGIIYKYE